MDGWMANIGRLGVELIGYDISIPRKRGRREEMEIEVQ